MGLRTPLRVSTMSVRCSHATLALMVMFNIAVDVAYQAGEEVGFP